LYWIKPPGFEQLLRLPESPRSMADPILFVRGHLGQGFAGAGGAEMVDGRTVDAGENAAVSFAKAFAEGVSQDIPIWENKVYRERPILTKGEAGILAHRKWAQQFYD
jgi:hypothetical protein